MLYFLAQSFRAKLLHELPQNKNKMSKESQYLAHRSKALIKDLCRINFEIAQLVVTSDDEGKLPDWFLIEVIRDLPRLVNVA